MSVKGKQRCEEHFLYGDKHFTLSELLRKSKVLDYLRRNKIEPSYTALRKKLRKGLRNGSINQEVVMEYSRRTKPIPAPRTISKVSPAQRTKPIPAPRKSHHKERNPFLHQGLQERNQSLLQGLQKQNPFPHHGKTKR